jgi:hypothetical protein
MAKNKNQGVLEKENLEKSVTKSPESKDYKGEFNGNNMGGHGYFGLPKYANYWIRFFIIIIVFAGMGIFLINLNQLWAGIISFGVGLMFLLFNNLLKD